MENLWDIDCFLASGFMADVNATKREGYSHREARKRVMANVNATVGGMGFSEVCYKPVRF